MPGGYPASGRAQTVSYLASTWQASFSNSLAAHVKRLPMDAGDGSVGARAVSHPGGPGAELNPCRPSRENRAIAAVSISAYVVSGAVAVALAGWIVLLLLLVWGRRDAPPYWDE